MTEVLERYAVAAAGVDAAVCRRDAYRRNRSVGSSSGRAAGVMLVIRMPRHSVEHGPLYDVVVRARTSWPNDYGGRLRKRLLQPAGQIALHLPRARVLLVVHVRTVFAVHRRRRRHMVVVVVLGVPW